MKISMSEHNLLNTEKKTPLSIVSERKNFSPPKKPI